MDNQNPAMRVFLLLVSPKITMPRHKFEPSIVDVATVWALANAIAALCTQYPNLACRATTSRQRDMKELAEIVMDEAACLVKQHTRLLSNPRTTLADRKEQTQKINDLFLPQQSYTTVSRKNLLNSRVAY